MNAFGRVRWGWVFVTGLLVEIGLLIVAVPINFVPSGDVILLYLVVPLCAAAAFLGGWWIAGKVKTDVVLHGALVGLLAMLLYAALTWTQELPFVYHVANVLKIVAGAAGAFAAARGPAAATADTDC
jgi:putative membrane protein (TIGR04086 family)